MAVEVSPLSGLITAFVGTSREVPPPAELAASATAIASLIARWDERAYTRALPRARVQPAAARTRFGDLRAQHGACRVTGAVHQGIEWRFELACDRGGGLALGFTGGPTTAAPVIDVELRPRVTADGKCPTR